MHSCTLQSSQTSLTSMENAYCTGKSIPIQRGLALDANQGSRAVSSQTNVSLPNSLLRFSTIDSYSVKEESSANRTPPILRQPTIASSVSSDRCPIRHITQVHGRQPQHGAEEKQTDLACLDSNASAQSSSTVLDILSYSDKVEERCLQKYCYRRVRTTSRHLQGEIFEAVSLDDTNTKVRIKKVDKKLHSKRISIKEDMHFVVDTDIIREGLILHHLTVKNQPPYAYLARFIGMFESQDAIYLVTEHVDGVSLQEFMQRAHLLILQKKMSIKHWKQIVKFVMWQICTIVYWLHNDMNCCHLDLNLNTIMVQNADFIQKEDQHFEVDGKIQIKIVDFCYLEAFRVKEKDQDESDVNSPFSPLSPWTPSDKEHGAFSVVRYARQSADEPDDDDDDDNDCNDDNDFACSKRISTEKDYLLAPRVYAEDTYDARKADVWAIGVLLLQLATGCDPYHSVNADEDENWQRIQQQQFEQLMAARQRSRYVNPKMLALLRRLLNLREESRICAWQILQCPWFEPYFNRHRSQIEKHSVMCKARKKKMNADDEQLLYYN